MMAQSRVDIVVPVYNAAEDLLNCVDSVLACTRAAYTLRLIDDASPDPAIATLFDAIARRRDPRIELLRNERNAGFTATANRGMQCSRADVVLLNSDTIVTAGWLDALLRCAASDPRIATVTPFSNNAEICSFPRFCENNRWNAGEDPERTRQALEVAAVPTYPDLPTGVGFCLYVRRAAIDDIGGFDVAFGAGYGEENDFCLRAARAGWRNVLADDAFVVHTGGRSFADRKRDLGSRNLDLLVGRHPHYDAMVRDYISADPLRPIREAALRALASDTAAKRVLHVMHDRGGGTETHVRTLIDASPDGWTHCIAVATGDRWRIEEPAGGGRSRWFGFERRADESWADFLRALVATFGVSLVHVHHLSGSRDGVSEALPALGVPYGITIHDLWFACPTVTLIGADARFCGGVTDTLHCADCLAKLGTFTGVDISRWRREHAAILSRASFVVAPSKWAADMLVRYFPELRARVDVIAQATPESRPSITAHGHAVTAVLLPDDGIPAVAIVGAIGQDKGARRVERLAARVRARRERVRLVVVGYLDVQHTAWQSEDRVLTVHGAYARHHLATLLAHYRVGFVVYPSDGPESFSYTLSESWQAGVPALVPPIGALYERVADTGAGWVMTESEWHDEDRMLDRVMALLASAPARAGAAARARSVSGTTAAAMADATFAHYAKAIGDAPDPDRAAPFCNARIRDAMGYRRWIPPQSSDTVAQPPHRVDTTVWQRIALGALAARRTPMGRLLYRITPEPVIDALKARLHG
jgi:O-antigen biosynthesis protein